MVEVLLAVAICRGSSSLSDPVAPVDIPSKFLMLLSIKVSPCGLPAVDFLCGSETIVGDCALISKVFGAGCASVRHGERYNVKIRIRRP